MAHEPHLDHPGEITWWVGHGPAPILGPCPHEHCGHHDTSTVAWSPDFDHYELVNCIEAAGCAGECRGWLAQYPDDQRPVDGVGIYPHGFKRFDPHGEHWTTREERRAVEARIARERAAARAAQYRAGGVLPPGAGAAVNLQRDERVIRPGRPRPGDDDGLAGVR